MKKNLLPLIVLFCISNVQSASLNKSYVDYIEKYAPLAISKMNDYGIPASITLAQGLLESGAGKSRLAVEANNHFGIKCHSSWKGATITHDDDAKNECFRKYPSANDSYEDHSQFLKAAKRYENLFLLKSDDYKGWAHGLSKAGYATEPTYPQRLIKLIEDYSLYKYDDPKAKAKKLSVKKSPAEQKTTPKATPKKETAVKDTSNIGSVKPFSTHKISRINGVKAVKSIYGDTYASIAEEFGLTEKEILRYNDLQTSVSLEIDETVYLKRKKAKSNSSSTHTVREGETLHSISQLYGITINRLSKLNGILPTSEVAPGSAIHLR